MPGRPSSNQQLADRLVITSIRLTRTLRARWRSGRLSGPEISALAAIVYSRRLAAKDLARLEEVTPATISRLVAQMERKGLVRRTADAADARVQWIVATALGARLVREGHEARIAPLAEAVAALPRSKRQALADAAAILEEITAALGRSG